MTMQENFCLTCLIYRRTARNGTVKSGGKTLLPQPRKHREFVREDDATLTFCKGFQCANVSLRQIFDAEVATRNS